MNPVLSSLRGVGPKTEEKLHALGIADLSDAVNFLPIHYIDLDSVSDLQTAENGVFVLLNLQIVKASKPFSRGRLAMFRAEGKTEDGTKVSLVWFNSNYHVKKIVPGARIKCYGKIKIEKGYQLINAVYELPEEGDTRLNGIKPIYRTRGLVPQATFAAIIGEALKVYKAESMIDDNTANKLFLMPLEEAYRAVHKPVSMDEIRPAQERVALEDIVKRICAYRLIRSEGRRQKTYPANACDVKRLTDSLPYTLTPSQRAAVDTVISVLKSDKPLNAMLTGDVGSGKTAVALIAAYFAALSGYQTALMAPTEILAMQHYKTFTKYLSPLGIKTVLLTGGLTAKEKKEVLSALASGDAQIAVGTHAVISKTTSFQNLALAVIDEQHRFGVAQRTALIDKAGECDILTLSATPIPRSLRLTMFGDIDVIDIERRYPADNIVTAVVEKSKRRGMLDYIAAECKKGKQAYIVAPLIYDDEGLELEAAEGLYREITKNYPDMTAGLLHGKQSAAEKTKILSAFSSNECSVLVSTTVIEVGIDVPNASIMAVFNAESFGLATLHQLRGRIGRNGAKAYCFLYTEKEDAGETERLKALVEEKNGFALAERDYEMRGAGEWLGESQSGKNGFTPSLKLMKTAREIADNIDIEKEKAVFYQYGVKLGLIRVSLT